MKELISIQSELKAPKNQTNKFGNYKYRSCEDILEAVKPLLKTNDCVLTISDEVINVGDSNYVKATATLKTSDSTVSETVSAFAREAKDRKGMDDAQITGATSSYARKYALNGLFAIDDTKDSDFTNKHEKGDGKVVKKPNTVKVDFGKILEKERNQLLACKTKEELQLTWKTITNKTELEFIKNEVKDELAK